MRVNLKRDINSPIPLRRATKQGICESGKGSCEFRRVGGMLLKRVEAVFHGVVETNCETVSGAKPFFFSRFDISPYEPVMGDPMTSSLFMLFEWFFGHISLTLTNHIVNPKSAKTRFENYKPRK